MIHRESGTFKRSYREDMALYPLPLPRMTMIALGVIAFLLFPLLASDYYLSVANLIGIACLGAIGLNILVGYTGQIRWDVTKPNGQPRRSLDVSRAEQAFGFKAATDFDEGLARTIAWYLDSGRASKAAS